MNDSITVKCPACSHSFSLGEGVLSSVREGVTRELSQGISEREKALEERLRSYEEQQAELRRRKAEMAERVEALVGERLEKEMGAIRDMAEKKAAEDLSAELASLKRERDEKSEALKKAREDQVSLLDEKRKLRDEKEAFELESRRKLDEERDKLRDELRKTADEENRFKVAEKEKLISELQVKLQEAQRKAAQGSIQTQGEVFELDFEQQLRQAFPLDNVTPVSTGARGADLAHEVISRTGRSCGTILFENKRTKSWQDAWITKLRNDMREARADIGLIVTETLPKGIDRFGQKDGVWVSDFASAVPLVYALRSLLCEVTISKGHREGAKEKMEMLYEYLTGNEFRQRVQLVIDTFGSMRSELDKERAYVTNKWNRREKQINIVIENMAGMVGDVQGLSGGALQGIPLLEEGDEGDDAAPVMAA